MIYSLSLSLYLSLSPKGIKYLIMQMYNIKWMYDVQKVKIERE